MLTRRSTCLKVLLVLMALLWTSASGRSDDGPYDLVIRHGRIVDGAGNPWFTGDVAVRGDRIVAVGHAPGTAKREIDAKGLIVSPGFIDMHSHSDWVLLEDGHAQSKIRQGVTTDVLGEGDSAGPFQGKLGGRTVTVKGERVTITRLKEYFDALEKSGVSINVASYVGLNNLWESVMGQAFDRPTPEQIGMMKKLAVQAMEDGARGLSSQIMMPPGSLAKTDDIVEICRDAVRPFGGIYSVHVRNEGTGIFDSVKEVISIAERAGIVVDNIHLKISDQQYWGRMNEIVAMIEQARKRGVEVQANVYPYTRGNNNLSSIIPPWAHEGGDKQMLARLKDPAEREKMKRDIRNGIEGWYNHYTAVGGDWSRMLISANNPLAGLTMDRVIAIRTANLNPKPDPLDVLFDVLIENGGSVGTVYAHHTEEDMNLAMAQPWCSIGSDGSAFAAEGLLRRGNPHPRNFGTFPRVLGVYVREKKVITLEEAIRKMTSLNANRIGLTDRGLLRPAMYADITVFDADRIIDKSTYTEPFQYNEGIEYVIVNGQVVLEKGKHTDAMPGKALRRTGAAMSAAKAAPAGKAEPAIKAVPETKAAPATKAAPSGKAASVFEPGATPEMLAEQGAGEGPAWHPELGLLTSGNGHIMRRSRTGEMSVFLQDGGTNGLIFDRQGRLIMCQSSRRRVARLEPEGTLSLLAESYEGKKFNNPNDLTLDSRNRIYFSDPRYGDRTNMEIVDAQGKKIEGVYRIDPDGMVTRIITHEVDRPNGLIVTPDDKYLFVADNNNNESGGARKLWRFDLRADGSVDHASRKLIYDWHGTRGPDGMKLDSAGRLFVAAGLNRQNPPYETQEKPTAGVYVFSPAGEMLEFLPIPRDECTNCAFGDVDLKTLYVTAGGTLWSIRVREPGRVIWPSAG